MKNNEDENGISKELMLRDRDTGRWIKRSEEELSLSDNFIPSTFIQVVNNQIHYADTNLIISEMLKNRDKDKVEFLETRYNNILDTLENTRVYSSGFDKVFDECSSNVNEFDNEIRRVTKGINSKEIYRLDISPLLNLSNAYVKILFAYLYSAVVLHKEKVKNETVIYGKIKNLKSYILDVLEMTLIQMKWNGLDYESSIYQMYLYDASLDINKLDELIKYDRRFNSVLDFIKSANIAMVTGNSRREFSTIEFSGKFFYARNFSSVITNVDNLVKLLRDIERLEIIRDEIGNVDNVEILEEFVAQVKNDRDI